jgi:signal transduction histidine kinase
MGFADRLLAWSRRALGQRAKVIDGLAAAALTVGALGSLASLPADRTVLVSIASAVVCTSSVAWRRASPALAAVVSWTAVVAYQISSQDTQGAFVSIPVALTCYTVGRFDAARQWRVGLVAVWSLAACTVIEVDSGFSVGQDLLAWIPLCVLPILAGLLVARRARMVDRLRGMQARLSDEQHSELARGIAEERARIARELHDVVAHCVSVMVIQAGAARLLLASDVPAARAALQVVASAGREALADLRRAVGVRRRADSFAELTVGLAQLPRLIARMSSGGLDVHLHVRGTPRALPADVDLSAFRIVQEALTNVHKHAPSARVDVTVTHGVSGAGGAGGVELRVADTGPSALAGHADGPGHGLAGMRERVALHGGELEAGPGAAGGFVVHARLSAAPAGSIWSSPGPSATLSAGSVAPTGSTSSSAGSRRPRLRWRRLAPTWVDALFSAAWLVGLEAEALTSTHRSGPLALNAAVVAVMALVGVVRRRAPFVFIAVVGAGAIALSGGLASPDRASVVGAYTVLVCSYTVAAYRPRALALAGLATLVAGDVLTTAVRHAPASSAFGAGLMAGVVWLLGRVAREQRELAVELETATARLAADNENRALLARYDERARIARDLHTLVAQLVTTMVVQAQAADGLIDTVDTDPIAAAGAIRGIEHSGRAALAHMRQMLGVLRSTADPAPLRPQRHEPAAGAARGMLLVVPS